MRGSILFLALAGLLLPIAGLASPAAGQELTTPARLSRTVDLRNVTADANGTVSGTLVNHSDHTLLEVARVESEAIAEELDDEIVARGVVRVGHGLVPG